MQLKLASYNIHGCLGRDGRIDPARIVAVLQEFDSDVIALQEAPTWDGRGIAFLEQIKATAGLTVVTDAEVRHDGCYCNNVLLTRLPVQAVRLVDLAVEQREPRGAIDAELEFAGDVLQIIATHLGLLQSERRHQIQRLLGLVRDRIHPVALLGDINEWFAWGRPLRWLHAHFGKPPAPRTFPSGWPLFSLDRIWISRPARIAHIQAHVSPRARVASDHLPVKAVAVWD